MPSTFSFCDRLEQNLKHLISKKEKEPSIFQPMQTLKEVQSAQPRCIGYT
jgi:hypothetical protein